jgi:single-stranded DNA-specific DHH superfamily exonuclease
MAAPKRKAGTTSQSPQKSKKPKVEIPEYHLAESNRDENGEIIWPAPKHQMEAARAFITECAATGKKALIVPDKDADGLSSGVILYQTLTTLGLPEDLISVHLVQKGNDIHTELERAEMASVEPSYIFVLDQGSRKSPPVIDKPHKALIIDHHYANDEDFPEGAEYVSACHSPPVATSSLLTYTLCCPLHPTIESKTSWLCAIGTHGDLGNTIKWAPPFPDMTATFKTYTKKAINDTVSLLNAPRRTARYDVISAWTALLNASKTQTQAQAQAQAPSDLSAILRDPRLLSARAEINREVERCTHTAPQFSHDARIAVFRISSPAQVHPVIATRWAGHLQSKKLEIVLVANSGYLPGMVNFSCRIPKVARARDPPVNIIESLRAIARESESGDLLERLGESFARGHKEASGGIVKADEFEELMGILRIGEKPAKVESEETSPAKKKKVGIDTGQKNTLMNYFGGKTAKT